MRKPVVIIGGPTASGKSSLAVALARTCNGTVINADSLQIYTDLGILTAQPARDDLAAAPHDLYAIADANDRFDAMRWREHAIDAINRSHTVNRLPVIVGGTGFYIAALLEGLSPVPSVDAGTRAEVVDFYTQNGLDALIAKVAACDPDIMTRIDRANPQRLMRAYEVYLATQKPLSAWQALPKSGAPADMRFFTIVIDPPREDLHRNAELRIAAMQNSGMIDEVAAFKSRIDSGDVAADAPLTHACGYQPLCDFIDGQRTLDDALEAMLIDTRQYAKRQQTWFKNQITPDLRIADTRAGDTTDTIAKWIES